MWGSLATVVIGSAIALTLSASACGRAPERGGVGSGAVPTVPEPEGRGPTPAAPVRSAFGLDARNANATCVAPPRPPSSGKVKLEQVFTNVRLDTAVALAQPPGDPSRWFVAQRGGSIVSFPVDAPPDNPQVVADIASLAGKPVVTDVEGGLMSFVFHPEFATNGRAFVYFTTSGNPYASELGSITSSDGGRTFTSYTALLRVDRRALYHCGGGLAFGPDGFLYFALGDATEHRAAQELSSYLGKVLRLDVDHPGAGKAYGIPAGNPFVSGEGLPEIFAYGFRNPFRLSVDQTSGEVWLGDVGQDSWEEIDRVVPGGNHGWDCREGAHDFPRRPGDCPPGRVYVEPVFEYSHEGSPHSVIGGVVYRGAAMPWLQGSYVYSDYAQAEIHLLTFDAPGGKAISSPVNEDGPRALFVGFAEDALGEVFAISVTDSAIFKLVPTSQESASALPDRLSKTGCVDAADVTKAAPGLVPYGVNAELWSDGATKERMLAIPDGTTITALADGDLELPIGTVLVKTFSLGGRRIETRLLVRHEDGDWGGYSYEWKDDQSDAVLLPGKKTRTVEGQAWTFPGRGECMQCHTKAAGRSLGLEVGQLNGEFVYTATNRISNQLQTLEHIGVLAPLGRPVETTTSYPDPHGDAPLDVRARAYLHANCSHCHRPEGGGGRATMDFRFATPTSETRACDAPPTVDDLGVAGARVLAPGAPEHSIASLRMHALDGKRMPPLGTRRIDEDGVRLVDEWIRGLQCR
jgi:uncharacterized repeat protein (TIGR03806 family)